MIYITVEVGASDLDHSSQEYLYGMLINIYIDPKNTLYPC